jgi:hypothetical protein
MFTIIYRNLIAINGRQLTKFTRLGQQQTAIIYAGGQAGTVPLQSLDLTSPDGPELQISHLTRRHTPGLVTRGGHPTTTPRGGIQAIFYICCRKRCIVSFRLRLAYPLKHPVSVGEKFE